MKKRAFAAVMAVAALSGGHCAWAAGAAGYARSLVDTSTISYIQERQPTLAPFAQVQFCMRNPGECQPSEAASTVVLTDANEDELTAINLDVNRSIVGVNDSGPDVWSVNVTSGGCEDYALTSAIT